VTAGPAALEAPRRVPEGGMVVGDDARQAEDAPSGTPADPSGRTDRPSARRWLVAGAAVLVLAAGVLVAVGSDEPDVRVPDPATGAMVPAPPAPAGPIAYRWAVPVPIQRQLIGLAHVGDQLVWASRRGAFAQTDPGLVVVANATLDGSHRWSRAFDDPRTAVLVGSTTDDLALLASAPIDDPPTGHHAFVERSVVVALDADGTPRWEIPLDGSRASGMLDVTRRRLILRDDVAVREVDVTDGSITARMPHVVDGGAVRVARRSGDTWVVPVDAGWEVRADTGEVVRVDTALAPAVTPDLVVTADGSSIHARRRDGGADAWEVDLAAPVVTVAAATAPGTDLSLQAGTFPLPPATDGRGGVTVETAGSADAAEPSTTLVSAAGEVVSTVSTAERERVGEHLNVRIAVDGQDWSLCARSSFPWPRDACPHDVAVADDDGDLVGTVDGVVGTGRASGTWSRVTREGLVLQDGDSVELRRWPDLDRGWTVPDGAVDSLASDILVVTSTRGVGIGTDARTDSVAWYS